jgi:hypothetical protein
MKPVLLVPLLLFVTPASPVAAQVRAPAQTEERPGARPQDATRGLKPGAGGRDAVET